MSGVRAIGDVIEGDSGHVAARIWPAAGHVKEGVLRRREWLHA